MAGCTEVLETGQRVEVAWPKPGPNDKQAEGNKRVEQGHVAHADSRGASVMFPSGSYFWPKRKMANGSFYNTGGADVRILKPEDPEVEISYTPGKGWGIDHCPGRGEGFNDLAEWTSIIERNRAQS